ncbi:LacI family transcriptional regulator [Streptomyces sp. SAI-208]|uniref:LacI family DNA-binding transcriptional regulator n=1 Tax=unclassified Streptomyces TaxID=2593676 RepID=UPI00247563EB|nr:LacI family DNA-binding transcriptional regulator [Streptomyces sp. SAI-090]MDH6514130.1 LacI family transcriptional regulator [Streptomyces sp. SAI-090]MDH6589679.1 LacI family transcriptional regulator [Streptomyces sp. SAI-133]MDH6604968.1 LacI family transcriptional regulator [Streptomyces sp. SAI-208]MDH6621790.1 LacI family transcriptional regulator [Streptomyces sp. SAI-135]
MARGRTTLADVARHAGLSVTAASLVLNRRPGIRISAEAQARVFAAADELGYRPNVAARSLRTQKTATIAFVSDVVATTRFAGDMIRGALDAAREREHVMLIAETQGDPETEQHAVEAMLDRQIDGFVYAAMACRRLSVPPAMSNRPTVLLNGDSADAVASVLPDDEGAGHSVAMELMKHGHRRVAVIGRAETLERDPRRSLAAGPRMRGIRRALAQHGVRLTPGGRAEEWEPEEGYEAMRALLRRRTLTRGIICMNDRLALGAYQALGEAGLKVPEDVSVVSFDDDPIAGWLRPGLTTAVLPHEAMGRLAVEMLLDWDLRPGTRWVPMPLRERASVAPPRD